MNKLEPHRGLMIRGNADRSMRKALAELRGEF